MKFAKRVVAGLLACVVILCFGLPLHEIKASTAASSTSGFVQRTERPTESNPYYYDNNIFYQCGYGLPNCTCYAYGRAYELLGTKPKLCTGNAGQWWKYNIDNGYYEYGSEPKLGAIVCWDKNDNNAGHVAVVEDIQGDRVVISESRYNQEQYFFQLITMNKDSSDYYPDGHFQGYIYVLDQYFKGVYQVEVQSYLNVRSGPGTSYESVGKLYNDDLIKVTQVSDNWGKCDAGWVCLDFCSYISALTVEKPVVYDLKVASVTNEGYTLTANFSTNDTITQGTCTSWGINRGRANTEYVSNIKINNTGKSISVTIPYEKMGGKGDVFTNHIYLKDSAGNVSDLVVVNESSTESKNISDAQISTYYEKYVYTGNALKPAISVKYSDRTLKEGTDYTVSYSSNVNVGIGKITVTGKGQYTGTKTISFSIVKKSLSGSSMNVSLQFEKAVYSGKAKTPSVTIKYNNSVLTKDKDYKVTYSDNVSMGKAYVTIKGIGNYGGTIEKTFTIYSNVKCGNNIYWSFDSGTGVMELYGNGNMYAYSDCVDVPWYNIRSRIKSVVVGKKITYIGAYSFAGLTNVTRVWGMTDIKSIGTAAFKGSSNLVRVDGCTAVTNIGKYAFEDCVKLYTLGQDSGIVSVYAATALGENAFAQCQSIKQVDLWKSLTYIGNGVFKGNTSLKLVRGVVNVTTIGEKAFYNCRYLETIKGCTRVKNVGTGAFAKCPALKQIGNTEGKISLPSVKMSDRFFMI